MQLAITYGADDQRAEAIALDAARHHSGRSVAEAQTRFARLDRPYVVHDTDLDPAAYIHLTLDWLEVTVRFAVPTHGVAAIKDAMARDILAAFMNEGISIDASPTRQQILSLPPIRLEGASSAAVARGNHPEPRLPPS